jgi:enoyl-CoA hydratase/carnithine racemase
MGLVNRVVAPEELMAVTYDYARGLATGVSPASLAASKAQMYLDLHRDAASSVKDAAERLEEMMKGPDFAEGVAALTERRPPRFGDPPPGPTPADPGVAGS